jgi:hypothetical protein
MQPSRAISRVKWSKETKGLGTVSVLPIVRGHTPDDRDTAWWPERILLSLVTVKALEKWSVVLQQLTHVENNKEYDTWWGKWKGVHFWGSTNAIGSGTT